MAVEQTGGRKVGMTMSVHSPPSLPCLLLFAPDPGPESQGQRRLAWGAVDIDLLCSQAFKIADAPHRDSGGPVLLGGRPGVQNPEGWSGFGRPKRWTFRDPFQVNEAERTRGRSESTVQDRMRVGTGRRNEVIGKGIPRRPELDGAGTMDLALHLCGTAERSRESLRGWS